MKSYFSLLLAFLLLAWSPLGIAQLAECDQVNTNGNIAETGGCIARSLTDQVGTGQGDANTPGSSIYLIKRDPARSIRRGRQLFQRKFTAAEGQGPRVNHASTGDITQTRALGAGLADSCAACHGRPRGAAGFGGDVNTFPDSRDAPHLFGLGLVEMLADEMTSELRAIRASALDAAINGAGEDTLIEADFSDGRQGFVFFDDAFRDTSNRRYSSAELSRFSGDRKLVVNLGNVDNSDREGMSGGWHHSFELAGAAQVTIEFEYRLTQSSNYEDDEFSEALLGVNGEVIVVDSITGNGNGGNSRSTGFQHYSLTVDLDAGTHDLLIGAYNNKKTYNDESTTLTIDDVRVSSAGNGPGPVTRDLLAKGVAFGEITALPDGTVDTSGAEGVDPNLRVKPFFHQGGTTSMREFVIGAFKAEMGLEVSDPVLCAVTDPVTPVAMTSPSGFVYDPVLDTFERPPVCSFAADGDGDGVVNEINPALLDHMEFYLLNYFKPGQYRVTSRAEQGLELMDQIGCTSCHVQNLVIKRDRRVADVETVYDPVNGIFNEIFATASLLLGDPIDDGQAYPQLLPAEGSFVVRNFFSDLKRHDLGPKFEERDFDGRRIVQHVTEPLWGVGSSAPYGHDGRSINLDQVIRRHGGEAQPVTDAYIALSDNNQRRIREYLETLIIFPPDDTASNLNPGNPSAADPQIPANHGSINLGALFQIPEEGVE